MSLVGVSCDFEEAIEDSNRRLCAVRVGGYGDRLGLGRLVVVCMSSKLVRFETVRPLI